METPDPLAPKEAVAPANTPGSEAVEKLMVAMRRQGGSIGLALTVGRELTLHQLGLGPLPEVGRYLLEKKLGEGGMGAVFLARDPHLERPLAIKILRPDLDESAYDLLAREAKVLARLNDPHVLTVHDVGARDGQLWLAMEYVEGGTLRQWRQEHPNADWREIVRHYVGAARGLAAAHRAGVVHRDFKPDNVMLGADERVRVADFGLAVLEGHGGAGAGIEGVIVGTPFYMPPEAARGDHVGPAGDQYSFFVALAEALSPEHPLLALRGKGMPPKEQGELATRSPDWPRELDELIERGLHDSPGGRHPSMDEVARILEAMVASPNEDPRRRVLLDRVEALWLGGVLDAALGGRAATPLQLLRAPELVDSPWAPVQGAVAEVTGSPTARTTQASLMAELAHAHGSMLIVGAPGSGKTTALLLLARALSLRARAEAAEPLPVVLNLASLSQSRASLATWLVDELVTKYGLPRIRAREWLENDALILLLDGLDEVAAERRRQVAEAIDAFRRDHPVTTVVACREDNYASLGVRLRFSHALRIAPLDEERLDALCASLGPEGEAARSALSGQPEAPTPLIVALLARASAPLGRDAKAPRAPSPSAAGDIWSQVVERAVERPPPLGPRERERLLGLLGWLAATLSRRGMSDLWLERMDARWLARRWQQVAARLLGVLAIVTVLFAGNLLGTIVADRPPLIGVLLGVASLPMVILFNRGLSIRPGVRLVWSWRASLRRLPLLLVLALAVGAMIGAFLVLWVNIVLAVSVAFAMAPIVGLVPEDREEVLRPGQGLFRALQTGFIVGPVAFILCGVVAGYVAVPLLLPHVGPDSQLLSMEDPSASLFWSTGVFAGLCVAFVYGWTAVALHIGLRVVMALFGIPLRLAPWLDRAVDRGLLRRVGGGWMFIHRTLLEHFASRSRRS